MCGLVALFGTPTDNNEIQTFKDLMTISCLRGKEGSGVMAVKQKGAAVRSVKSAFNAAWLVDSAECAKVLEGPNNIVVGHARYPTKGDNTEDMAHPHRTASGRIIGVHNGTMHSVNGNYSFKGSDSLALYESIDTVGLQETINNSWGAYALMWVDEEKQTFNVVRNHERTLWTASIKWKKSPGIATMYMASEADFLQLAISRRYNDIREVEFQSVPVNKHFVYPLRPRHQVIQPIEVIDAEKKPQYNYGSWKPGKSKNPNAMFWSEVFGSPDDWEEELVGETGGTISRQVGGKLQVWDKENRKWKDEGVNVSAAARLNLSPEERAKRMAALRAHEEKKEKKTPQSSSFRDMVDTIQEQIEEDRCTSRHGDDDDIRKKGCCVCGEIAEKNEKIFPLHASTGVREYLCVPCASDPDYQMFVPPSERHLLKKRA